MKTSTGILVLMLPAALTLAGCADSLSVQSRSFQAKELRGVKTVAVVDFAGDIGGQAIADMLTMHLVKAGFQVVERDNLQRVLEEQKMGAGQSARLDVTEAEQLSLIGRNIAADLVITGELVKLVPARYERVADDRISFPPATCEITARAIDTSTSRVIWTCVVNVTAAATDGRYIRLLDFINEACIELVASLKDPGYGNKMKTFKGREIEEMRKARPWKT